MILSSSLESFIIMITTIRTLILGLNELINEQYSVLLTQLLKKNFMVLMLTGAMNRIHCQSLRWVPRFR